MRFGRQRRRGWGGISLLECHWGELEQFALNGFEFGIREDPAAIYHVQPTTLLSSACNVLLMLLSGSKGVAGPLFLLGMPRHRPILK
ncbi:hypothetical protein TNCT_388151 [Trichonephila clavata]|uniref:Uncharacterized protein n=1 Tax=Trichonephila clavata TaxID=2740835 RepID=A0A8X6GTZ4_TRICU|nr:hypothetical protein TNCT_388151 [Trichonephila clavata]